MLAKIDVQCNGCGITGVAEIDVVYDNLNVGGVINVSSQPCQTCGGSFFAPGGYYQRDASNIFQRTGDFRPLQKVELECTACGKFSTLTIQQQINTSNIGSTFDLSSTPCPSCGSPFIAPGGYYERDSFGVVRRTG